MSQANIPNIDPIISVNLDQSIVMLLSSIALGERALAHLVNAEAEKIQYAVGTLVSPNEVGHEVSVDQLLALNHSVYKTIHEVVLKELLLLLKLQNVLDLNVQGENAE